jgi:hypothetical protein
VEGALDLSPSSAIAKPELLFPGTATLKSTRPSGSGDLALSLLGHTYSGFALAQTFKLRVFRGLESSSHENLFEKTAPGARAGHAAFSRREAQTPDKSAICIIVLLKEKVQ